MKNSKTIIECLDEGGDEGRVGGGVIKQWHCRCQRLLNYVSFFKVGRRQASDMKIEIHERK